jgi:hypothetical protein
MTNWYASTPGKNPGDDAKVLILTGEGVTAHDLKQYAARVLGTEDLLFQETGSLAKPDVQLQWIGEDYNGGGTPNAKRLQVRKRTKTGWTKWTDL